MKLDHKRQASSGEPRRLEAPSYDYPLPSSSGVTASAGRTRNTVRTSPNTVAGVQGSVSRPVERHNFTFRIKQD
jgi:hypothetical protein